MNNTLTVSLRQRAKLLCLVSLVLSVPPSEPQIKRHPTNVTLLVESKAVLPCVTLGNPKPDVTWLKDDELIKVLQHIQQTGCKCIQTRISKIIELPSCLFLVSHRFKKICGEQQRKHGQKFLHLISSRSATASQFLTMVRWRSITYRRRMQDSIAVWPGIALVWPFQSLSP